MLHLHISMVMCKWSSSLKLPSLFATWGNSQISYNSIARKFWIILFLEYSQNGLFCRFDMLVRVPRETLLLMVTHATKTGKEQDNSFRAVLGLQQNWGKYRDFLCTYYPRPQHASFNLLHYKHYSPEQYFFVLYWQNSTKLTNRNQKSIVFLQVHS